MPDVLRRLADEADGGNAADHHGVVRDQAVAALDQLDGRLAFADAAVAHQQDALAVDLHQHAVARDARRQLYVHEGNEPRHEAGGRLRRGENRNAVRLGCFQQLRNRLQVARDDDRRRSFGEKLVQYAAPPSG